MRSTDIALAKELIDGYLTKKITKKDYNRETGVMTNRDRDVIVDDGQLDYNDAMMTSSQADTAQCIRGIEGNDSTTAYWFEYGKRIYQRFADDKPMGIRCDTCTALAFYLLRANGCTGTIAVIEQGKGNATGHWFLLVGCSEEAEIKYPTIFPRGSFVVDLWAAGVSRQRGETITTAVFDPSAAIYDCGNNSLKRKVLQQGSTTIPTTAKFLTDTTVAGCFGNKGRSSALRKLDESLDDFHNKKVQIQQVAKAFTDWTAKKQKRQGEEIDTIRNIEGAMTGLRGQLRWLDQHV